MSKLFAIYPIDKSSPTSHLNRINTFESRKLGDLWHCYKVHFSDEDHKRCIEMSKNSEIIFFMGHGKYSLLEGACAKNGEMQVDTSAIEENKDFYNKKVFIFEDNISAFKDKIFISFSCNSNRKCAKSICKYSIEKGVKTFVGFGDIPTDYIEETHFSKRCIAIYKGKIVKIMKYSIYYAMTENTTVDCFVRIIKLLTSKEIQLLRQQTPFHGRKEVIKQLYKFKNEIVITGDMYSKL